MWNSWLFCCPLFHSRPPWTVTTVLSAVMYGNYTWGCETLPIRVFQMCISSPAIFQMFCTHHIVFALRCYLIWNCYKQNTQPHKLFSNIVFRPYVIHLLTRLMAPPSDCWCTYEIDTCCLILSNSESITQ